jgi:hypothetical protein
MSVTLLILAGVLVAFNIALILFSRNRFLNWLTRPIRARFMMRRSSDMDYRQARAIAHMMDVRERRFHR